MATQVFKADHPLVRNGTGYSREFTPRTERRIKIEIDRVPPTLNDALRAKVKREGLSIRSLTLQLWKDWIER